MEQVFLGIVDRDNSIFIPWRGTKISTNHEHQAGQYLLVTLDVNDSGVGKVTKIDLPTLAQVKQIKEELNNDWYRMAKIFEQASMVKKVLMLKALDETIREQSRGDICLS